MKKLAIIGCGGIGSYHLGHFQQFKDLVELAGWCDLIPERAEAFKEKAGCGEAYTDYKTMLDEVKPDMVFVCVPPYCHGEIEFDLIERGIHFFVEKPLALDLDLARKIRDAAEAKGLITASGFQCRYADQIVQPAKKFCEDNSVLFVECSRIGGVPEVDWWRKKSLSGGQAAEQTIHQFDIIRYLIGDPVEVFTYNARGFITEEEWPGYDTDDLSVTACKFANGALCVISTGCYATSGNSFNSKITFSTRDKRMEHKILGTTVIYGEEAAPQEENDGFVVKGDGALTAGGGAVSYKNEGDAGLPCDRTFIEAVITGDPSKIRSSYRDAFKSVSFTLACNKSMESGLPVKVELE